MIKLPKVIVDFLLSYTKSARIDAALVFYSRTQKPMHDVIKPGAKPRDEEGVMYWEADDLMKRWEITCKCELKISNNSSNPAYNLVLINGSDIFDAFEQLPPLTTLKPGESTDISVQFKQYAVNEVGVGVDDKPDIPVEVENKYLILEYENEKGRKFQTHSLVSLTKIYNVYRFKE